MIGCFLVIGCVFAVVLLIVFLFWVWREWLVGLVLGGFELLG